MQQPIRYKCSRSKSQRSRSHVKCLPRLPYA